MGVLDQTCLKRKLENVRIINFKQTSPLLKFVTFNMRWSMQGGRGAKLISLVHHSHMQADRFTQISHFSFEWYTWTKRNVNPPLSQKSGHQSDTDNIPGSSEVLTVATSCGNYINIISQPICVRKFTSLSRAVFWSKLGWAEIEKLLDQKLSALNPPIYPAPKFIYIINFMFVKHIYWHIYRVFFHWASPLKKLDYGKARLGEVRCI